LLGAFNVDFVVVGHEEDPAPWLGQRDLALIRTEGDFHLFENVSSLPRAGVLDRVPPAAEVVDSGDPALLAEPVEATDEIAHAEAPNTYSRDSVSGPGVVWLAEERAAEWRASVDGRELTRTDAGWANAFDMPSSATGPLVVEYPRSARHIVWKFVQLLVWIVIVGGAFSTRGRHAPLRGPSG
jgi:hypothetical protein